MERFKEDRQLDNKRIPCKVTLIHLWYVIGDKKVTRRSVKYTSRSGYCLYPAIKNYISVNYTHIGKLFIRNYHFNVVCYTDKLNEAMALIRAAVAQKKQELLNYANSIPDL
jgi:hypothetical protein